jgi:hypothetical protein
VLVLAYNFASVVLPELLDGEEIRPFAVDPGAMTAESAPPGETGTESTVSDGAAAASPEGVD